MPKIVVFIASLEYWIVNLLVIVTVFVAGLIAVIEVWVHQCVKARQGEGSLKSRVYLGIPTLRSVELAG